MANLYISSDHRGFDLKSALLRDFPLPEGFSWVDLGPTSLNPADDYNDAANAVCQKVLEDADSLGVLLCGSGIGVSMQANRHLGIRATVAWSPEIARIARLHEDVNVLCFAADYQSYSDLASALQMFLKSSFSGEERYIRRIKKLDEKGIND